MATNIKQIIDKAIIGTEETIKEIKRGNISKVLISSNCSEEVKEELNRLKEIEKFELEELKETNQELGTICKKPFKISILSLKKEEK